jgi:hypothetical protein
MYMAVWGFNLWSTCAGVYEGLAAVRRGPWRYLGAEEALGIVRLLCSNTTCQALSAWIGLPRVRPSGVFLVAELVGSRG